jgi:hypothetical protein
MRVRPARVGNDEDSRLSETRFLRAQDDRLGAASQRVVDVAISRHAVTARPARTMALELQQQCLGSGGQLARRKIAGARSRALHDVGKSDPVARQHPIVLGLQPVDAEGPADRQG